MLRDDGSIALIDFGMSKDAALALDITETGTIFGTPHYMSPEQGHAEALDERSDLYSLGIILFEMLTREKPYRAENPMAIVYKHRKEAIPRLPQQVRPGAAGARAPARQATRRTATRARRKRPRRWRARSPAGAARAARVAMNAPPGRGSTILKAPTPAGLGGGCRRALAGTAHRSRQLREEGRLHGAGPDVRLPRGPRAVRRARAPGARGAAALRAGAARHARRRRVLHAATPRSLRPATARARCAPPIPGASSTCCWWGR